MNPIIITYSLYFVLSLALTVWVARTLSKNGLLFLVDCFHGNRDLAESVNHLLVVGFYLINLGFVALFLKIGGTVEGVRGIFEALSGKLGVVLLVLGIMHFFNLLIFSKARRSALRTRPPGLPVEGAFGGRP
jgi:hypothetical protein